MTRLARCNRLGLWLLSLACGCAPRAALPPSAPGELGRLVIVDPGAGLARYAVGFEPADAPDQSLALLDGDMVLLEYPLPPARYAFPNDRFYDAPEPHRPLPSPSSARAHDHWDADDDWRALTSDQVLLHPSFSTFHLPDPEPKACVAEGGCFEHGARACVTPCPEPAPPEAPDRPEPPSCEPCPDGWGSRLETFSTVSFVVCEPLADMGTAWSCPAGQMLQAGLGCRSLGACADRFAPAPEGSTPLYVDAQASPGGDGSELAPFDNVASALAVGDTLLLAEGDYDAFALDANAGDVTLIGACADKSRVRGAITVNGAGLTLIGLQLEKVEADAARLRIQACSVLEQDGTAVSAVGGALHLKDVSWTGELRAYESEVEGVGLTASGATGTSHAPIWIEAGHAVLSDVFVSSSNKGIQAKRAELELARVLIEDIRGIGLDVNSSSVSASDVLIRHGRKLKDANEYGIWIGGSSRFTGTRIGIVDQAAPNFDELSTAVLVLDVPRAQFYQLWIRGGPQPNYSAGIRGFNSGLRLDHVAISGVSGPALRLDQNSEAVVQDLYAADVADADIGPRLVNGDGYGVAFEPLTRLELVRAWLGPIEGAGLAAITPQDPLGPSEETTADVRHVTIDRASRDGLRITGDLRMVGSHIRIQDATSNGIFALFGQATLDHVQIEGVAPVSSELPCERAANCDGNGVNSSLAELSLRRFLISNASDVGVELLDSDVRTRLEDGRIRAEPAQNRSGLRYDFGTTPQVDLRPLLERVVFEGMKDPIHPMSICSNCP